jgi:RNA polymerase sigma factor (sigma-70 family)
MRQRDPNHEKRLRELLVLSPEDCKRQIATAYRQPGFVPSEVLASLIRVRFGATNGVLSAAAEALHRRVVTGAEARIRTKEAWRKLERKNSEAVAEAIDYFWDKFLHDQQAVCNAEVRFAVYLKNKVDDYMLHLLTKENTMPSVDGMGAKDEDGEEAEFIDVVEDPNGESPEQAAMRGQLTTKMASALVALPRRERNAFYFRVECEYDWKKVADLLECSIPTARELVNKALKNLRGAL